MKQFFLLLTFVLCQGAIAQVSVDECTQNASDGEQDIFKSFSEILETMTPTECQGLPLREGQVKKFVRPQNWTGLLSGHAIKRINSHHYQAILNLNFLENGVADTPNVIKMREQVLGCIQIANKATKGPGKEVLEIKIIDPTTAKEMPADEVPERIDVNVLPPKLPSNMLNFSTMDCANITHEVFHMMGLVDEYDDSLRSGTGTQETCRIIPKRNTLMGLPSKFFEDVFGKTVECSCGETCQKFWTSSSPQRRRVLEEHNDPCSQLQALKTNSYSEGTRYEEGSSLSGDKLMVVRQPKAGVRSLLTPNQFKKILLGYCPVSIDGYQKCSSYSYFKRELAPGQSNPQCANIPAQCSDDNYYIGSP